MLSIPDREITTWSNLYILRFAIFLSFLLTGEFCKALVALRIKIPRYFFHNTRAYLTHFILRFWNCQKVQPPTAQLIDWGPTTSKAPWIFNRWNVFVWNLHGHNFSCVGILRSNISRSVDLKLGLLIAKFWSEISLSLVRLQFKSGCRKLSHLDPNGKTNVVSGIDQRFVEQLSPAYF